MGGCTVRKPAEGENPDGHGCGHNLLGAGAFGAALAVKEWLKDHPEAGRVVLFGCPSEEKGNGKTIMAREGVFDGLDAAFTWHPDTVNTVVSYSTLANVSVFFYFKGVTSHAAAAPEMGRSALDAWESIICGSTSRPAPESTMLTGMWEESRPTWYRATAAYIITSGRLRHGRCRRFTRESQRWLRERLR